MYYSILYFIKLNGCGYSNPLFLYGVWIRLSRDVLNFLFVITYIFITNRVPMSTVRYDPVVKPLTIEERN